MKKTLPYPSQFPVSGSFRILGVIGVARGGSGNVTDYGKGSYIKFPFLLKHNDNFPLPIHANAGNNIKNRNLLHVMNKNIF